ncbi:spore-associated protein A [Streptomyces sp. cg36]|uniref:spore-associated protein A n=1 Tax=Streptomyces sp. cg36 TaxID=3238798 RepID=UPI0034E27261
MAATATAVAGLLLATAPSARAAGYGLCGQGHVLVDSAPVGDLGTTYLTWNADSGENCVVVVRDRSGPPMAMTAWIGRDNGVQQVDSGRYTLYAGPVYVDGRGTCIDWGGVIHDQDVNRWHTHCG